MSRPNTARPTFLILLLSLGLGLIPVEAPAEPEWRNTQPQGERAAARRDRDWAVREAQRRSNGKVLSVQSAGDGYRVKVLRPDGRVQVLQLGD